MPFDPVLTLETAALMLVAFLLGATIGSLLRLAALRLRRAPVATASAVPVPTASAAVALVAAPVIAPLAVPRVPVVPSEIPIPDFIGADAQPPAPLELAPARKPGLATSGRDVGRPDRQLAQPAPEPAPAPLPEAEVPAIALASIAAIEAVPDQTVLPVEATAEPEAAISVPTPTEAVVVAEAPASEAPITQPTVDVVAELQAIAPPPDVAADEAAQVISEASINNSDEADEAAAMRAIEGSWTPGRRVPAAEPPAETPAVSAATASDEAAGPAPVVVAEPSGLSEATMPVEPAVVAVAVVVEDHDAQDAVTEDVVAGPEAAEAAAAEDAPLTEAPDVIPPHEEDRIVPAEASDEPEAGPETAPERRIEPILTSPVAHDQPPGIGAPRHGMRDDLTQIVGVLPVVESTLNRLGVYHFDQVADWSDGHAGWVEAHLGIAGRVDREQWREQARELAAIASGKRPNRKKRPH